jgi:predicted metal-dependent HD superfamily phosphohydrolase
MQLEKLKKAVEKIIGTKSEDRHLYHNLDHTLDVFEAADRLISLTNTDSETAILIRAAALLHETGMTLTITHHEEASVQIATEILPVYGFSNQQIEMISRLILSTKLPQKPFDEASKILCDADLDYLGRKEYFLLSHKLRYEWIVRENFPEDLIIWYKSQIVFLEEHQYFTEAAKSLRNKGKQHNLHLIKGLLYSIT